MGFFSAKVQCTTGLSKCLSGVSWLKSISQWGFSNGFRRVKTLPGSTKPLGESIAGDFGG